MPSSAKTRIRKTYQRSSFSPFSRRDTKVIADALQEIEQREGEVRISRLLEIAADKSSPLHRFIYADTDREAARKYRIELARKVCRAVRVVYMDDEDNEVADSPMLVSVRDGGRKGKTTIRTRRYISVERAFANPEVRDSLLDDALRDAWAWQERYKMLDELGEVFEKLNILRKSRKRA